MKKRNAGGGESETPPVEVVATDRIAVLLGLTMRRVQQLADEGALVRISRGRFDLVASLAAYVESVRKGSKAQIGAPLPGSLDEGKLKRQLIAAERETLRLEAERKLLLSVDFVAAELDELLRAVAAKLNGMPSALALRLAQQDEASVHQVLTEAVEDMKEALRRVGGGSTRAELVELEEDDGEDEDAS